MMILEGCPRLANIIANQKEAGPAMPLTVPVNAHCMAFAINIAALKPTNGLIFLIASAAI
jgi:hypothetical protein